MATFVANDFIFQTTFTLAEDPVNSVIQYADLTPWMASFGIDPNDVSTVFTTIGPDSIPFNVVVPGGSSNTGPLPLTTEDPQDVVFGEYLISPVITIVGGVCPGTFNVKSSTIELCDDRPAPAFLNEKNCVCGPLVKLTDKTDLLTNGWTLVSRLLTLSPPANAPAPFNTPYSGAGISVDTGTDKAQTGLWVNSLNLQITKTDPSGFIVNATIVHDPNNSNTQFDFFCLSFCEVKCCWDKQLLRFTNAQAECNNSLIAIEGKKLTEMSFFIMDMIVAENCGDSSGVAEAVDNALKAGQCTDDCEDCNPAAGGLIEPLCSSTSVLTFLAGQGMTVTQLGNNITYALDNTTWTVTLNVRLTSIVSTDGSVAITSTVNALTTPNTNIEDLSIANSPFAAESSVDLQIEIDMTGATPIVASVGVPVTKGTIFQTPTVTLENAAGLGTARIKIDNFYIDPVPLGGFKAFVQVTNFEIITPTLVAYVMLQPDIRVSTAAPLREQYYHFIRTWPTPVGINESWASMMPLYNKIFLHIRITE